MYLSLRSALNSPTSTFYHSTFYFLRATRAPLQVVYMCTILQATPFKTSNPCQKISSCCIFLCSLFLITSSNIPIFDKSLVEDHGWWVCIIGAASNVAVGCCTNISQQSFCFFTFLVASHVQYFSTLMFGHFVIFFLVMVPT